MYKITAIVSEKLSRLLKHGNNFKSLASSNSAFPVNFISSLLTNIKEMMDDLNLTTILPPLTNSVTTATGLIVSPVSSTIIIKSIFLALISIIGIVGNVTVIVLLSRQHRLPQVTYYFFFNLAIADLLSSVICSPIFAVLEVTQYFWPFGEVLCKIVPFLQTVVIAASSFAAVSISIERYLAATKPLTYQLTSNIWTKRLIICITWLVAVGYALPNLLVTEIESFPASNGRFIVCTNVQPYPSNLIYFVSGGILIYVCPMIIIVVCYWKTLVAIKHATSNSNRTQEEINRNWSTQKQTILTAVIIIVVHFLCWAMFYTYVICDLTGQLNSISPVAALNIDYTSRLLGYSNACWNPIIYVLRGKLLRYKVNGNRSILSSSRFGSLSIRQKFNTIADFSTITTKAKESRAVYVSDVHQNYAESSIDAHEDSLNRYPYNDGQCI